MPRLLVIMGSGETSPTMTKVHRELFARLGPGPVPAVVLDTPFGFQENADDIVAKAVDYFRESVNRPVEVASFRSVEEVGSLEHEKALTRLREARWVFSGPGSPSYALQQWSGSQVPAILADKLRTGGCVTFASAAAATLGRFALPVYEIYKVGAAPRWLDGLDLIGTLGLPAVVIPHFNSAEGGNHDTRYCYMGERRLTLLEAQLPEDVFILGVDEHTACIFDLEAETVSVAGRGAVTVRKRGRTERIETGRTVSIRCLLRLAAGAGGADNRLDARAALPADGVGAESDSRATLARSPFLEELAGLEASFASALQSRDANQAVTCVLELEDLLVEWSRDTLQSDELARGRSVLRSMIVRLGDVAQVGVRDPRETVAPLVEALLSARRRAREERRWGEADAIRDSLVDAGVEVRDTPSGTEWEL
jgi:cyanophycinase-like exopeptidase